MLTFEQHITNMVRRACRLAGLMFHTFSSRSALVILPVFTSLVRPILEYASSVWNPCSNKYINLIESVQRRVTKRLYGLSTLSYSDRLIALSLPSLRIRREYADLVQMYKIVHGLPADRCRAGLTFIRSRTRGHSFRLRKPRYKLRIRKATFFVRTVNLWNALPAGVVNSRSLVSFKHKLRCYML